MDFLFNPVRYLWRYGPEPLFYGGKDISGICSSLTSVPAAHWIVHDSECDAVVDRHVHAWNTLVFICLYFTALHSIMNGVLRFVLQCCLQRRHRPLPLPPPSENPQQKTQQKLQ